MKKQLAFMIARAQVPLEWIQGEEDVDGLPEDLLECLTNSRLSQYFKKFGEELGVSDPKSLEDIYKSHLEPNRMFLFSLVVKILR